MLTRQQHDEQQRWLEAELEKPRSTPFLALSVHHPLYSNGIHRDNPKLIAQWDSLLRRHKVDLYLSGHDHDLQHLEFKGIPLRLSFPAEEARSSSAGRHPPENGDHGAVGFTDLQISHDELAVRHIGKDATVLYEFKKSLDITRRI